MRPAQDFGVALVRGSRRYFRGECNECRRLREKARRDSDPDRSRASDRARYHNSEKRRAEMKRRASDWARANQYWQVRYARMKGAPEIEKVDRYEIYERDDGICHLCGEDVSRDRFDLDHLIPLSKGGPHTARNLKVAHPSCNRSRGALPLPYQIVA